MNGTRSVRTENVRLAIGYSLLSIIVASRTEFLTAPGRSGPWASGPLFPARACRMLMCPNDLGIDTQPFEISICAQCFEYPFEFAIHFG